MPEPSVVERLTNLVRDLSRVDAEVGQSSTLRSGPPPYVLEHLLVEDEQERVIQHPQWPAQAGLSVGPRIRLRDVLILDLIEIRPCQDKVQEETRSVLI